MTVRVILLTMTRDIRDLRDLRDLREGAIICCPSPRFSLWGLLCPLVSWVSFVPLSLGSPLSLGALSDSNIAFAQDNILVHQHHGLQKCNLHSQRIANDGILRYA